MSNLTPREKRQAINLGNKISEIEKLQKASHIAPRLPYSSVPEGNLVVTDSEGNVVDVIGPKGNPESGDQPVLPGREPSKPSVPILTAYLGTITATWDGTYVEDYVAPDLLRVEVHSSTDDDFETSAGTLIGTINGQRGGSVTLGVEYGTHFVRFVAVSTSGSRSVESDIASVEVTPLVETIEMTEVLDDIDQRFGGVITEAQQLNDKLAQAETDISEAQAGLNELETVRLPAVEANIEAAHQEIVSTGADLGARLDQAEIDLNAAESGLDNLKNTELPALKQRLADAEADITASGAELSSRLTQAESDLSAHDTRIEQNKTDLTTLNNTTLPALNTELTNAKDRLTSAEGELSATKDRVTTAEGTLNTLKNTTIPALNTDLTNAKNRLTTAETEITGTKTRLTDAEADLDDAFGQITAVDTKAGNAQTAASNAQTAVDNAVKELDRVWATARRSFYWAGDTLDGVTTTSTFDPAIVNVADAPASSSVLRKNGTNGSVYWDAKPIPFDPSALYKITYKLRVVSGATNLPSPVFYAGVHAWDASPTGGPGSRRATSGIVSNSGAHYFAAGSDSAVAADGWVTVVGYFQGLAPEGTSGGGEHKNITDPGQMVSMTKYISPMALLDYPSGDGVWDVGMVAIDVVPAELQAQVVAAQAKADEAKARADSAHIAAGTAQSTADNALTMAGSKSKVFYSTSDPSGTASVGDTWRKVNASNDVIAEWRWTAGNTWLTQQITSEAISNLDVGKLTAGSAIINTAVVNKIAIQTADVIKLNASAITAGTISSDRLNVNDLAAKIATVIQLNADRITSGTIDTGRLNATEVAAAVATVIQLNASRITAGTISTDRLNATEIAARVATVIQLNADRITAGIISTDRLDVNDIAAKTASFQKVDIKNLFATTGTFSEAVIEKLWADVIRARKITADQLLVGSGTNLIVDPYLEDATVKAARATASSLAGGYGRNSTTNLNWYGGTQPTGSIQTYYFSATSSRTDTSAMIPIVEGSKYRFKFLYNSSGGGARPVASIVRKDGTTGVTASGFITNGVATSGFGGAGSGQTMEAVWTPDPSWNYAYFVPGIQWESTVTSAHIYGGASVQDMTDGSLIVNGSIDADKINTNSVVAEVAKFLKLDVSNLTATNATMDTAVVNKLWTDVVRSRKITTDQLLVGQGENLIPWDVISTLPDRTANFVGYGGGSTNPGVQANGGVSDGKHLYMVADWVTPGTGTNTWRIMSDPSATPWGTQGFKVEPEEEFQAQIYVRAGGSYSGSMPSIALAGVWYTADGTYIATNIGTATSLTWLWDKREVSLKAPATAAYLQLYVRQDQPGGVRVDLPSLYRKKGASLIVDGAIEAKHITASESMSAKMGQFLKLDVKDLISTGTAKLNDAVIDKLWTDVVHSKKITSDMVVIGGTNNLIPNANFLTDLDGWGNSSGNPQRVVGASFPYLSVTSQGNVRSSVFEVNGGGRFRFKIKAQAAATGSRFYVQVNTNGASNPYPIAGQTLTTGWVDYTGEVDLPSDATTGYINIYVNHSSGIVTTQRFANLSLIQMSSGELIVDGAITATKIATNAIEADKIKANAITADKIDTGAIKAQHISSKEITADKLRIGQGSNVFPDPLMQDAAGWPNSLTNVYTGGYGSSNRVRVTAGTGQTGAYYGNAADDVRRFPVVPGRSYVVSVWVRPTVNISANSVIAVFNRLVKETGTGFVFTSPSAVYNSLETTGVSTIPANTWVKMEGKISVPSDATNTFLIPGLYLQSGFPTGSSCDFSNLNISEAVTGELIVEGSITTDKLKADAIDGMTITGAQIVGSRYVFNGSGAGNGYNVVIDNDSLGAYTAWEVPNQIIAGTIRAFDNDPWSDYLTPTITIRPPSVSGYTERDAVKISAGIDGGSGGLMDVTGNLWVRGEIRGRARGGNNYTSIGINDHTVKDVAGATTSIKSLGMYNRTYTPAANLYITSNGYIGRTTSLRANKLSIEDIPRDQIDALLDVNPRWWFDRGQSERLAEYLTALEDPNSPIKPEDIPDVEGDLARIPGLVAEEVEASGATAFVTYDKDEEGNLQLSGVNYDRIGPALIPLVREQRDEIADLKSRLALLEAKVDGFHPPQV